MDSRAFGFVEQAKLYPGHVGVNGHFAAQGIDLPNDLALCLAANRWVAAHLGDRINIAGQEQGRGPHARSGQTGLHAGMAGAANDHIERFLVKNHDKEVARK